MTPTTRRPRSEGTTRVGARIRALRKAAHLTQKQLAAGRYTGAYISALEKGLVRPSMAAMEHIAKRLNVPPADLLKEEPKPVRPDPPKHVPTDATYCIHCNSLWPCGDYIAEQLAVVGTLAKLGSLHHEKERL